LPIENHITRHYQLHRFELDEPAISIEYSMEEAMIILKAAAHTLDQQTGLSFHGSPSVAQIMIDLPTRELPPDAIDPLDDFVDYCVTNLDYASSEPMVSYIKRFQNRGVEIGHAEPCKHAACSRTHPTNECCICRGPHFVNRCWHVIGLPEGIAAIKDNFFKQHTANDGPWKQGNDRHRPPRTPERQRVSTIQFEDQPAQRSYSNVAEHTVSSIQPKTRPMTILTPLPMTQEGSSTSKRNTSGTQSVEQEAANAVEEDPLQSYPSPLVNHFIQAPSISSLEITSIMTPLLMPLPEVGPVIDDDILDSLYYDHVVSRVSVALPQRKEIKSIDYVWFHLDTGATCTVSHCSGESHC
jgi:hypothetical protein